MSVDKLISFIYMLKTTDQAKHRTDNGKSCRRFVVGLEKNLGLEMDGTMKGLEINSHVGTNVLDLRDMMKDWKEN